MNHLLAKPCSEMEWGTGRKSKWAAKISLLLSGDDGIVQYSLIMPLMASIAMAYPQATELELDRVMTITATFTIVTMLFASRLSYHFDKKKIMIIGTLIFATAGLCCCFTTSLEHLTIARALTGIGAGLAFPHVPSAIAYLFIEKEKNQMMGWMNSLGAFFSFVLSAAAGIVALVNWHYAFLFYAMFYVVVIIQWFCLPSFKPEKLERIVAVENPQQGDQEEKVVKEPMGWKPWVVFLLMLCFVLIAMVSAFKMSLFIEFNGLGTSASTGLCNSVQVGMSFLISLFFEIYYRTFKRFAPVVSLLFLTISFTVLSMADSIIMCAIGQGFLGLAMGSMIPFFFSTMSRVAPRTHSTFCMSLICIVQVGGQIVTPYYILAASMLGFATERALFGFTAAIVAVAMAATFFAMLRKRNQ